MTRKEFAKLNGITVNSIEKEINNLYKKIEDEKETKKVKKETVISEGHGDFKASGHYITIEISVPGPNEEKYLEQIEALQNTIKEVKRDEKLKAKIRRYKKDIEKLEEELAYKKQWLLENE